MADERDYWDESEGREDLSLPQDLDIEALLSLGYEQLDGFARWLEQDRGVTTRYANQDCFNAEMLMDYLANLRRKSVHEINEYDLRWFVFSHYIRKAEADAETEERLPVSLRNFFAFLRMNYDFETPAYVEEILEDVTYYNKRRQDYDALDAQNERRWEEGFREWCAELSDDLDLRCLSLPRELGDGLDWGDTRGWREATLWEEANNNWQNERAELMRDGIDYETVRANLMSSYLLWVDTPQLRLDDKTPAEVILEERLDKVGETGEVEYEYEDDSD